MQKIADRKDEQFNLQMRRSLKQIDNPLRLRVIRRNIARIETLLAEDTKGIRKLAEQSTSILGETKTDTKASDK
jgi:large subunit ribosomal protein L29